MDSEARAHVVDGQKRHSASFLGRGLNVCSHRRKKREYGLQKQSSFCWWGILNVDSEARAHVVDGQKRHASRRDF